jgi:hypothetical protein
LVSVRLLTPVSSGGALPERAAAQLHLLDFGRHIGLVEGAESVPGGTISSIWSRTSSERTTSTPASRSCPAREDPAGEHALTQWSPGEDAQAVLLRDRKDLTLDAAVQDRIRRLLGTESFEAPPFGDPLRLDDGGRGCVRRPDRANLAVANEIG